MNIATILENIAIEHLKEKANMNASSLLYETGE